MLFCQDKRASVIANNPSLKPSEVAKILGKTWIDLSQSERIPYEQGAAAAKAEYDTKYGKIITSETSSKSKKSKDSDDTGASNLTTPKKSGTKKVEPETPKRVVSPFIQFCSVNRAKIIAENPELIGQITELAKLLGAQWKELSEEEKAQYSNN